MFELIDFRICKINISQTGFAVFVSRRFYGIVLCFYCFCCLKSDHILQNFFSVSNLSFGYKS
jgi:hypothetical protein